MHQPSHHDFDSSEQLPATQDKSFMRHLVILLRNRIFAGMVILLPIYFTVYVVIWLGDLLHRRFENSLGETVRSIGGSRVALNWLQNEHVTYVLVILLSIILIGSALYLVGLISTAYAVKRVVATGERLISKIPVISFIYNLAKQIAAVAVTQDSKKPKKVVFIEYPRKGIRSVAFATGETVVAKTGEHFVNLFLPSTPNPTTGFLLMLPPDQVWETNLTIEQATKFILSFGLMAPEDLMMRPYRFGSSPAAMPRATIPEPEEEKVHHRQEHISIRPAIGVLLSLRRFFPKKGWQVLLGFLAIRFVTIAQRQSHQYGRSSSRKRSQVLQRRR